MERDLKYDRGIRYVITIKLFFNVKEFYDGGIRCVIVISLYIFENKIYM